MPEQKHTYPTMPYPAEKARQGEIILRSRWQRVVFIAGLGGALIVALIFGFVR
jgi:hypothetical protein